MIPRHSIVGLCLAGMSAFGGCATVDPRLDYEQAGQQVRDATGQANVYQPQDDALVAGLVEELLRDGLTADEAVQVCLLNNPTLQAAFMDVGMARADVVQSGLLSNPTLGISLRLPSGGGLASLEAGLAQNIAELWQIPARKRAAQRSLDGSILELANQASNLAADAKVAYFEAAGTQQLHATSLENLEIARELLVLSESRQEAGAGTVLDVNLSLGLVLDAELEAMSARLAMAESRRSLARLLGLTSDADEIVLRDPLPQPPARRLDANALVDLARKWRLDIRAARQAVAAAEARLEEQYSLIFPSVEVGVELERGERGRAEGRKLLADTARASIANGGLTAPQIQPRSERKQNTDFIIGPSISLELPIFDQNQAQIAKARFAHQQALKTLDALDKALVQEVRGALDRAATAWELAELYETRSLPLAERNLELSRRSYQVGKASFLSVLEAQRFFLESRGKYIEVLQAAAGTIADLERTVGRPYRELVQAVAEEAPGDAATTQPSERIEP